MAHAKSLICTTCPLGCTLTAICEGIVVQKVEGNQCPRGAEYAEAEIRDPRRVLTTTVKVRDGIHPLVPVCTNAPFPKSLLLPLLIELRRIELIAPVKLGQPVLKNVFGTGIDVIASRDLPVKNASS